MGTTPTIKLVNGTRTLNLVGGRYRVAQDFVPPATRITTSIASGASSNRYGEAVVSGQRAETRQLTFSIDVYGDTEAEVRRGLSDLDAFLKWAGDENTPLYLYYKPNSDTPEPTWGQDGALRYEILDGAVTISPFYGVSRLRERYVSRNPVSLTMQPYAIGLPQAAAQAKGSIHHDSVGSVDGRDRGLVVSVANTNHFTNPIFGNAAWSTGWTAGANLTATENTEAAFIAFGVRSAKLQATGATRTWTQSLTLTAATYTLSFYARRPDGAAITSATCSPWFNGSSVSGAYTDVGGGWYRVTYSGTGSAGAATYGAVLAAAQVVYVDGFQVELSSYATPLAHGDMYGSAFSSTTHASTTTRTTPYLRVPLTGKIWNVGSGSIRTVVTFPTGPSSNPYLWYEAATGLRLYYDTAASRWTMTDGTNTITSGAGALTAGTSYVVHATWSSAGLAVYVNGASSASGGSFTPSASAPTYLYIGSTSTPANHQNQVFSDFVVWGVTLTSGQVASDYANIAPLVADRQRVTSIPYCWTKDGDNQVDNYNDSTRDNWGLFAHIPGTATADTEYVMTNEATGSYIGLALWSVREFINPGRVLYFDQGVAADAGSSNGDYYRLSIGTTETNATMTSLAKPWASDPDLYRFVEGREWYSVVRARVAGTGKLRQKLVLSPASTVTSRQWVAAPATYFRTVIVPSVFFPALYTGVFSYPQMSHYITAKNTASVNTDIDYYCLFPRPMAYLFAGSTTRLRGGNYSTEYENPATFIYNESGSVSDRIDLEPDAYNVLLFMSHGTNAGTLDSAAVICTFTTTTITPRYSLV